MKTYRLRIVPHSSWGTPWHADTLFGCLCWRRYQLHGEKGLGEWLKAFDAGKPPFVLSDAFPGDLLPAPVGPDYATQLGVKVKPPVWVRAEQFAKLCREPGFVPEPVLSRDIFKSADRLQASIGRLSNEAESGGALFEVAQHGFVKKWADKYLSVYVRADDVGPVVECFAAQAHAGFGKKSSTGLGGFGFDSSSVEEWRAFEGVEGANGFVSLSHFVPGPDDPVTGRWRVHVKYPKFQGNAVEHPFKGRLLTLTPGSTFRCVGELRAFYGRMIRLKAGEFENAMQYGLCFAAAARVE